MPRRCIRPRRRGRKGWRETTICRGNSGCRVGGGRGKGGRTRGGTLLDIEEKEERNKLWVKKKTKGNSGRYEIIARKDLRNARAERRYITKP